MTAIAPNSASSCSPSSVQQPEELSSLQSDCRQAPAATPHFQANAPIELLQIILLRIVNSGAVSSKFTQLLNSEQWPLSFSTDRPRGRQIPLKASRRTTETAYRSALPQVIAVGQRDHQAAIAGVLQTEFRTLKTQFNECDESALSLASAIRGITVTQTVQSDLEFCLQAGAIAYWLNRLLHPDFTIPAIGMPVLPDIAHRTFTLQHAHARSYGLSQQALIDQQQALPPDNFAPAALLAWHWSAAHLPHLPPAGQSLIPLLIQVLDWMVDPSQHSAKRLFFLTEAIAQGFTAVHQACQLWHPDFQQNRDRRQAYGQLLLTTQRVLQRCLHSLGAIAPLTL